MVLAQIKPKHRTLVREVVLTTIALSTYACAFNMFILPQGFVGGGFGGICSIVYYLTGIPVSASYLAVNIVLCLIAYIVLGHEFSIKTVFGILGLTFFLAIIPIPEQPVVQDKLLSAIMGGIIAGASTGTYLLQGASTGGSDILVMIISKYKNISWGKVYLAFDACVISSSIFLPDRTLETVAYGFVYLGVHAQVIDVVHSGIRQSVQMFIFTSKYQEIADRIINTHRRGVTLFESIGWYTKQHTKTIFLVARKRETQEIFKTVKAIDEHAFIAVSNAMSVFGVGFDAIKAGFRKVKIESEGGESVVPVVKLLDAEGREVTCAGVVSPEAAEGCKCGAVSEGVPVSNIEDLKLPPSMTFAEAFVDNPEDLARVLCQRAVEQVQERAQVQAQPETERDS